MTTCTPRLECQAAVPASRIMSTAFSGRSSHARTVSWSNPGSRMSATSSQAPSSTSATAVTRWRQKCPVPDFAEPEPSTRPIGVRKVTRAMSEGEPVNEREDHGRRDDGPPGGIGLRDLEAVPEVPGEVPDPVREVEKEGERQEREQQATGQRRENGDETFPGARAGGRRHEAGDEDDQAERQQEPRQPVPDR